MTAASYQETVSEAGEDTEKVVMDGQEVITSVEVGAGAIVEVEEVDLVKAYQAENGEGEKDCLSLEATEATVVVTAVQEVTEELRIEDLSQRSFLKVTGIDRNLHANPPATKTSKQTNEPDHRYN